ncbi:MAG: pyridoxal phosphate-dependent aminotransferase [Candidatus Aenigmarchaeota archaeon]|nr:pyridoxal phosphate-dependent aminotransferase [Candidatus Aenigmarchaeota archaeon]
MSLSKKLSEIAASPTLALNSKAKDLSAKGVDVVNFTAGEPDFDTPDFIKEAAMEAIRSGFTKYTAAPGMPELREAIAKKLRHENGLDYPGSQIVVSCGGKHSLYNVFQALCNPGDEVIVPTPFWVSYSEQVKLCSSKPVFVGTREENGFRLLAEDLEKRVSSKTKAILLNSPCNPTGAVIDRKELKKIASIAVENGIYVVSDEIYEYLVYEGEHVSIASLGDEIRERTITVNGASKAYSMTGWRIGWAAGPADVMKMIGNFQSHTTSNPASISQKAYLAALNGPRDSIHRMRDEFRKRRDLIVTRLNEARPISCIKPHGSFYVFPNVSACLTGGIRDSMSFSRKLLEEARVAVVPGSAFGGEGHVRISYACSKETIEKGIDRIVDFLKKRS